MNIEEMFRQIDALDPGEEYDATLNELVAIRDRYPGAVIDACYAAFLYGFLKGRQAEREGRAKC